MRSITGPLHLDTPYFRRLLALQGPSLGLWRGAEVAALREQAYEPPILDLGCGDGLVTSMVLPRVQVGLDPDRAALNRAARLGTYERFEPSPAEEASLSPESIGTVVSNSVLEHLSDLDAVLKAVTRVLRPGGRLVFTTPTESFSHWLALPSARYAGWRNQQLNHLNLWPLECWVCYLERAGLQVEVVRPYLRATVVRAWDVLELLQQIWIAGRRLAGVVWRHLPGWTLDRLARMASTLDLSAPSPGGGRLMVARKS